MADFWEMAFSGLCGQWLCGRVDLMFGDNTVVLTEISWQSSFFMGLPGCETQDLEPARS